jgi:opacity protein-like surface antigen
LKPGKSCALSDSREIKIYGILGMAMRKISVRYDYADPDPKTARPNKFDKNIQAFVPGVGVQVQLNEHCALGVEYKCQLYPNAKNTKNFVDNDYDYDTAPRNYALKTRQNSLSLRLVFSL